MISVKWNHSYTRHHDTYTLNSLIDRGFLFSDVTYQYDTVFWLGDLNFRLAVNRDHVFEKLKDKKSDTYQHLMQWDQLSQARQKGKCVMKV